MFSKFNSGFSKIPSEEIDFSTLAQLIKNNPNQEKILQIRELRSSGNVRYKNMKLQLPCVTVNSVVRRRKLGTPEEFEENFIKGSGYVYLDFDCGTVNEAIELKNLLATEYRDKVAMVCFSSSMGGVSVLVRYAGIVVKNEYQFKNIRKYIIENYFSNLIVKPDPKTSSVGQSWFIPSDEDIFVNYKTVITVPDIFQNYSNNEPTESSENVKNSVTCKKRDFITLDFTLLPKIKDFLPDVKWCTDVEVKNKILDVKEINYYKMAIPQIIKDGKKRDTYLRIFTTFMTLNPHLDIEHAISFLNFINKNRTDGNGMPFKKFERYILDLVTNYRLGKIKAISRKKNVHFNSNSGLNRFEKNKIVNQMNGKLKANDNIMKIIEAKKELVKKSKNVTKVAVQKITGLSRPTIDRWWNSELYDIDQMVTEINEKYN